MVRLCAYRWKIYKGSTNRYVKIEKDVEIGSNCTIDKGSLKYTVPKNGVKIDNLVHIAHNVLIGENTVIAGQTTVGSTNIGSNVMIEALVSVAT